MEWRDYQFIIIPSEKVMNDLLKTILNDIPNLKILKSRGYGKI